MAGGRRKGAGRKKGDPTNRGRRGKTPGDFMREMVPAGPRIDHERVEAEPVEPGQGFGEVPQPLDPIEFCLAVINGDMATLMRCGVAEFPTLDQKIQAARFASPYTNKKKPLETI